MTGLTLGHVTRAAQRLVERLSRGVLIGCTCHVMTRDEWYCLVWEREDQGSTSSECPGSVVLASVCMCDGHIIHSRTFR